VLKNIIFLASIVYTFALLTVCLITLRNLPDIGVSHGDKIFHFLAYGMFTLLWVYTFILKFEWHKKKAILFAASGAVLYGILIEVLQGSVTTSRSFDYYDALANSLGAVAMGLILMVKNRITR
jgi:VanZ family protein